MALNFKELREGAARQGVTLPGRLKVNSEEVNRLALKVLGVLAEAPDQETRKRALAKATAMLKGRR